MNRLQPTTIHQQSRNKNRRTAAKENLGRKTGRAPQHRTRSRPGDAVARCAGGNRRAGLGNRELPWKSLRKRIGQQEILEPTNGGNLKSAENNSQEPKIREHGTQLRDRRKLRPAQKQAGATPRTRNNTERGEPQPVGSSRNQAGEPYTRQEPEKQVVRF
jgi:hypothetical protein